MKQVLLLLLICWVKAGFSQILLCTLPFDYTIYGVDVAKDGSLLFIAGKDSIATIWKKQKLIQTLEAHRHAVSSIDYLDKEQTIITGSYDHTAILWGLDGKVKAVLRGHSDGVINVTQTSEFLGTASRDKTAKIWTRKGELLFTLPHSEQVNDIQFIKEKQWIVTGSFDGILKIWSYAGALLYSYEGHLSGIRAVGVSIPNNMIVTGHQDGTLSILSLKGALLHTLAAHGQKGETYKVINVVLFNDESTIITAGADGYVKCWGLDGKLLSEQFVAPEKDAYVSGMALSGTTLFTVSGGEKPSLKTWKLN